MIQQIHAIVDPGLPPGLTVHYNGSLEISETYNRITLDNQTKFTAPIFLLVIGALYAAFTLFAIVVSLFWTLGLYSLLGFSFNVLSSMIVPLIVVLAIADDVHMMQRWDYERRRHEPEEAFKRSIEHLLAPLLGASVTTALGMLSLATSSVAAVQSFGIGSAMGIMIGPAVQHARPQASLPARNPPETTDSRHASPAWAFGTSQRRSRRRGRREPQTRLCC